MAGKRVNIAGQRFGRLVAVKFSHRPDGRSSVWVCECDCGNQTLSSVNHMRMGATKSCGCLNNERRAEMCCARATHGNARRNSQSPTYVAWCNMINRCSPSGMDATHYHGRGIMVCERWKDFANFLFDMGERPTGATLDRIDNDRGYEPGNCRWASWYVQQNNKRSNRVLTIGGERMTMRQAADRFGVNYNTLRSRIYLLGMDAEEAVRK